MKTNKKSLRGIPLIILSLGISGVILLLPIKKILSNWINNEFINEYTVLSIKMGFLWCLAYYLIKKLNLVHSAGLSNKYSWKYKYLNLIPIYLILLGILNILGGDLSSISLMNISILFIGCQMVGFAEEYLFRGVILSILLKKNASKKKGVFLSILLSSLIFGLFHLLNILTGVQLGQVLVQVVFATFIGFFFAVLLLKTNKIIPLAITHGLINFFLSLNTLPALKPAETSIEEPISIAPIILFLPLLIIGLFHTKKLDKTIILEKL